MACNMVLRANGSIKPEVTPRWVKETDFYQGENPLLPQPPTRDYEKSLYRLYLYYEALAPATFRCDAVSRRGQLSTQDIAVTGTSGKVDIAIFDLALADVLIKVTFEVICGEATIIMAICEHEPKGQLVKGT